MLDDSAVDAVEDGDEIDGGLGEELDDGDDDLGLLDDSQSEASQSDSSESISGSDDPDLIDDNDEDGSEEDVSQVSRSTILKAHDFERVRARCHLA